MKILYAIQGTGNGHVTRAREIVPLLKKDHEVDILISGIQADVELPFEVNYRFHGLSFIFGKKGNVDIPETYKKSRLRQLVRDIKSLPVNKYDLVINDFEPVSAWACYFAGKSCVSVSHQAAVINKKSPKSPKIDPLGKAILRSYAPAISQYGFHFQQYDKNIFTPVIRKEVRRKKPVNKGHYTVYLPSYDDGRIVKVLSMIPNVEWQVFSKHNKEPFRKDNIWIRPINNDEFIESMVTADGVFCGAGFETPAEALFLKKKLMVIPMKGQYEQQCNAAALKDLGVPVIKSLKKKHISKISEWVSDGKIIPVNYPDKTAEILADIIEKESAMEFHKSLLGIKKIDFRPIRNNYFFKKIERVTSRMF
ncbi:glycosyltransferase family protein [Daejeonella sp. H1SJ63]|uniref:glycosyltransferase family protein n=1 Tax=Daejeonella sp. H1SJ63 TaxID=3034145 RepID=UPI0023ED5690|nr:glycosyltransferase family protein [Daejeonella sp. H1SJ63]